jgi:O-antigen ligase
MLVRAQDWIVGRPRTFWVSLAAMLVVCGSAGLSVIDPRLPFGILCIVVGVVCALEQPMIGVALLIAGRVTSTGASAWVRIWKFNIDLFEPSLLLALGALLVHAALHHRKVWVDAPWRTPVALFLGWQLLGLLWSTNLTEGVKEVAGTCILFATTMAILAYIRELADIRTLLTVWVGASLLVALASALGLASTSSSFEMAQGSRASGFGQHPNWFSMNLMYSVLVSYGMGLIERSTWRRVAWIVAGTVILIAQMQSGSRGGTGALIIGGAICTLFEPRLRRLAFVIAPIVGLVVAVVIGLGIGDSANAFARIFVEGGITLGKGVRVSNWEACWHMFVDTWGVGIGPGGYEDLLVHYDTWLAESQYRYPHGIFWGILAHQGAIGVALWLWFLGVVARMGLDLLRWTRNERLADRDDLRVVAWAMIATLIGYFAWSWVEFSYEDKPFWEYLGLFTALWEVGRRRAIAAEADAPALAAA